MWDVVCVGCGVCEHACVCEGVNALGIKAEILYQATCQAASTSSCSCYSLAEANTCRQV